MWMNKISVLTWDSGTLSGVETKQTGITIYPDYSFSIILDLDANSVDSNHNVFRFTVPGKVYPEPGRRIPAIFQLPNSNRLKICTSIDRSGSWCAPLMDDYKDRSVKVTLSQTLDQNKDSETYGSYVYAIYVDDTLYIQQENTNPQTWENVEAEFGPLIPSPMGTASTPDGSDFPQATGTYSGLAFNSKCDQVF